MQFCLVYSGSAWSIFVKTMTGFILARVLLIRIAQPRHIETRVAGGYDKGSIHIRRDQLHGAIAGRTESRQQIRARQSSTSLPSVESRITQSPTVGRSRSGR